jgi:hypothetical protein
MSNTWNTSCTKINNYSFISPSYSTVIGGTTNTGFYNRINSNHAGYMGGSCVTTNVNAKPIESKLEQMTKGLTDKQKKDKECIIYKMVYGDVNIKERKNELMELFLEPIAVQLAYYEYDNYMNSKLSLNGLSITSNGMINVGEKGGIVIGEGAYTTKSNELVIALDKGSKALKTSLKVVPVDNPTPVMLVAYMEIIVNGEFYKLPLYS